MACAPAATMCKPWSPVFHNTKYYYSPKAFINSHFETEGHRIENLDRCHCFNSVFFMLCCARCCSHDFWWFSQEDDQYFHELGFFFCLFGWWKSLKTPWLMYNKKKQQQQQPWSQNSCLLLFLKKLLLQHIWLCFTSRSCTRDLEWSVFKASLRLLWDLALKHV